MKYNASHKLVCLDITQKVTDRICDLIFIIILLFSQALFSLYFRVSFFCSIFDLYPSPNIHCTYDTHLALGT